MKRLILPGVIVVLLVAGYFGFRQYQKAQAARQATQYQTVKIERGNLTAIVGATGTVRANQTATVSWQTTGFINKVYFQEGDTVKSGQVIADLDPASLPQTIIMARADLANGEKALEALNQFATNSAQAQVALIQAQDAYDKAKKKRDAMNYPRASDTDKDNAYTKYQLAESQLALAQNAYNSVANLPNSDLRKAEALNTLTSAQMARDQALGTYNWLVGKPGTSDIAQADANLALAKAQLDDAQRSWDILKNGPDPRDVTAAKARIAAAQATLATAQLVAPFSGTLTDIGLKHGDQVSPAAPAFRIDDLTRLLVDVQISEVDINRVALDQQASLTFDAAPGKEYQGKVVEIARVGTVIQSVVNFIVTVEIDNPDQDVRPGMTAAVNIVVRQLNDVLLVPIRAIRVQQGERRVYLLQNGNAVPIPIELGASSDTMSEVLSTNLKAGDEVILNPPSEFQTGGGNPFR